MWCEGEGGVVGGCSGDEAEVRSRELGSYPPEVYDLALCGVVAPRERGGDILQVSLAGEPDIAAVLVALDEPEPALGQAGGGGAVALRLDSHGVLTDEGALGVHRESAGHGAGAAPGGLGVVDGVEELAVLEHLGPDAAVDAAAEVLDELAVDVLADGLAGFRGVDRDAGLLGLAAADQGEGDLVERGGPGRQAPAAEEAVDHDRVVELGVELDGDWGPVV